MNPRVSESKSALLPFEPVTKYASPPFPTDESVRVFARRFLGIFRKEHHQPFIAEDRLQRTLRKVLNDVAAPPACGPLLRELELSVGEWVAAPTPERRTKLIVLPPGEPESVVETWARERGHQVLAAPERSALVETSEPKLPDLTGDGLLVIPQLERWFLRHRHGLIHVRRLLAAIDAAPRTCLIGCNSWAWKYLQRAVGAGMILPEPLTFRAFDEARLQRWFSELSEDPATGSMSFRLSSNGEDVMAFNEAGKPKSNYFTTLAAHSFGIPWVAWLLWRRGLRSSREEPEDDSAKPAAARQDEQTLWIVPVEELSLPEAQRPTALLVLHALLIHGHLTADELRLVLPIVGESFIVASLIEAGFVARNGTALSCRPIAYPAVRHALSLAGFPMAPI